MLFEIVWNFEPRVVPSWEMPVWYGIMWALGYLIGLKILEKMYKSEDIPQKWVDSTFIYILIGGILGARLGHVFFYEPAAYLKDPVSILKIWEGGLASHGGAVGIIIACYVLSKKVTHKSILWVLDRAVVPTAFAAGLIRMGNLFNHEIVGKPTGTDFGFKFLRNDISSSTALRITNMPKEKIGEAYDMIANDPAYAQFLAEIPNRYPTQLYEAICYFVIFIFLMFMYWKTNAAKVQGFLLGAFFVTLFGARFFIEFMKENQDGFDQNLNTLNMGQILSIPLVLIGFYLMFRNFKQLKKGKNTEVETSGE